MPDLETVTLFVTAVAALFGAAVGSFLNVCVYRLPREGLSPMRPARSFCPSCGDAILARDNVPILGWLALGGRCRGCRSPISLRYVTVEAATAALFAVLAHRFVPTILVGEGSWGGWLVLLLAASALIVASFIDMDLRIIPDEVTIPGMHLVPLAALIFPDLHTRYVDPTLSGLIASLSPASPAPAGDAAASELVFWGLVSLAALASFVVGSLAYRAYRAWRLPDLPRRLRDISLAGFLAALAAGLVTAQLLRPALAASPVVYAGWAALAGLAAGAGLVWLVGVIGSRVFRKPAMGFGDVKLMGLIGALTGWKGALIAFFLACLLGAAFGVFRLLVVKDRYLPFGPFLAAAGFATAVWPGAIDAAIGAYLDLFR